MSTKSLIIMRRVEVFLISLGGFVLSMANVKGQARRRGTADYAPLLVRVSPDSHTKLDRMAAALGISKAAIIDAWLTQQALDETDRPTWWTGQVPRDQQELPLRSA